MAKKRDVEGELSGDRDIADNAAASGPKKLKSKNVPMSLTSGHDWSVSAKHELSNKRRLQSIKDKQQEEKSSQKIIKEALQISSGKNAPNKKIQFDSDDDGDLGTGQALGETLAEHHDKKKPRNEMSLFGNDSDESDESVNHFEFKQQFEGEAGQKLLSLQNRFQNDKRFMLGERFLEPSEPLADGESVEEDGHSNEASKNISILQSVLGYQIAPKEVKKQRTSEKAWVGEIARYDPTSENAAKLEVKKQKKDGDSTERGKKKKKRAEVEAVPEIELPIVSEERFYEVADSLADKFSKGQNQTFSLGKTFEFVNDKDSEKGILTAEEQSKLKTRSNWNRNPFEYDSSSEEEEESVTADGRQTNSEPPVVTTSDAVVSESTNQPKQSTFFFLKDDKRLAEGIEFFRRHDNEDTVLKKWEDNLEPLLDLLRTHRKRSKKKFKLDSSNPNPRPLTMAKKRIVRGRFKKK